MRRFVFAFVVVVALIVGRLPAHAQIHEPSDGGGDVADTTGSGGGASGGSDGGPGGTAAPWRSFYWRDILRGWTLESVWPTVRRFTVRGL